MHHVQCIMFGTMGAYDRTQTNSPLERTVYVRRQLKRWVTVLQQFHFWRAPQRQKLLHVNFQMNLTSVAGLGLKRSFLYQSHENTVYKHMVPDLDHALGLL